MKTGEPYKENISDLVKMTAKQIYSLDYQAGEMADKKDVWNEAIEEAAKIVENIESSSYWAEQIRSLKK